MGALVASQADGDVGTAVMLGTQAALMDKQRRTKAIFMTFVILGGILKESENARTDCI